MRIVHTSDWHLGHSLYGVSQQEEQSMFLDWLLAYLRRERTDYLLVAGDLFDQAIPPKWAEQLFFDFVNELPEGLRTVIISGNHDSAPTFEAPQKLLRQKNVELVSGYNGDPLIFEHAGGVGISIFGFPHLRQAYSAPHLYKEAYRQIFREGGLKLKRLRENFQTGKLYGIGLAHLFVAGAVYSDSERNLFVGSLDGLKFEDLDVGLDYVALGHLHRAQGNGGVRYSGTPYPLSFSEAGHRKVVLDLTVDGDGQSDIQVREVELPQWRKLRRISFGRGDFPEVELSMTQDANKKGVGGLPTFLEVQWLDEICLTEDLHRIQEFAAELEMVLLKVVPRAVKVSGASSFLREELGESELTEAVLSQATMLSDLSPNKVFEILCKKKGFSTLSPRLLECFYHVMQEAEPCELNPSILPTLTRSVENIDFL